MAEKPRGAEPRRLGHNAAVIVTITTTHEPATDLGYLLHKHPDRLQAFDGVGGDGVRLLPGGHGERCTAALILEVDPIGLVRGRSGSPGPEAFTLGQYVNDRPYAASSMMSVALSKTFRTAMTGRCDARPELAGTRDPAGAAGARAALPRRRRAWPARLFAPLGWQVEATPVPLDPSCPAGATPATSTCG